MSLFLSKLTAFVHFLMSPDRIAAEQTLAVCVQDVSYGGAGRELIPFDLLFLFRHHKTCVSLNSIVGALGTCLIPPKTGCIHHLGCISLQKHSHRQVQSRQEGCTKQVGKEQEIYRLSYHQGWDIVLQLPILFFLYGFRKVLCF